MRRIRPVPWAIGVAVMAALALASPALATGSSRGAFPGANGPITFVMDPGSGDEIYSVNPDGTGLHLLIGNRAGPAHSPDWSPDGRHLVFGRDTPHGCVIAMAKADGTREVDLTRGRTPCEAEPTFTPDGHRIVFQNQRCDSCTFEIRSMNLKGYDRQRIVAAPGHGEVVDISVSPNGTTVAFVVAAAQYQRALYTVRMNGTHLTRLLPFGRDVGTHFDWAPDGRHIVFTEYSESPPGHQPNVVTMRPDGTHQLLLTRVAHPGAGSGGATYAPDGKWIVYRYENDNNNQIWLTKMHPDGLHKTRIMRFPFTIQGTAWAPRSSSGSGPS